MKAFETLITASEVRDQIKINPVIIFDCRFYMNDQWQGRREYMAEHIAGAIYLHLNHELSSPVIKNVTGRHPLPHPRVIGELLKASGLNKDSQVVAYDQGNGAYASRLWWLLNWLGHSKVAVLDGGFPAWKEINGEIDNQWPIVTSGNFEYQMNEELVVEMNALKNIHAPIVDSREEIRYRGEYEPIDPVAGHIPGAICIPYMQNTDDRNYWKSNSELRKNFSAIEKDLSHAPVFYCGSGVTACHNILAYKIATDQMARLYPGSWSEWINYNTP